MPEPSNAGVELDDEGKPLAGVKAKQAAVEYLRSIVEQVFFAYILRYLKWWSFTVYFFKIYHDSVNFC